MKDWFERNGLSVVVLSIFLVLLIGQTITGWHTHNLERLEEGGVALSLGHYVASGHFAEATSEN